MVQRRKVPLRLTLWLDNVVLGKEETPPQDFMEYSQERGWKYKAWCVFHEEVLPKGEKPAFITVKDEKSGEEGTVSICQHCSTHINKVLSDTEDVGGRIKFYVQTGNLPSDATYYCTGHKYDQNCLFCHELFEDKTSVARKIYFPQGEVDMIYGAMSVCYDCDRELIKQFSDLRAPQKKTSYFETCAVCEKGFQVDEQEHADRVEDNTVTQHVCDSCLISEGFLNDSRIISAGCNDCENSIIVDRSLYNIFKAIVGRENYMPKYCEVCDEAASHSDNQRFSLDNFEVWLEGDILLTVYKVGQKWAYSVEQQMEIEDKLELTTLVDTLGVQEFDHRHIAIMNGTVRYYRELKQQLEIPFMNED